MLVFVLYFYVLDVFLIYWVSECYSCLVFVWVVLIILLCFGVGLCVSC